MISSTDTLLKNLVRKYLNNNLKTLAMIYKLSKERQHIYYSDIENYLNRGKSQVTTILNKLEKDELINRDKDHRPQEIFITQKAKTLMQIIIKTLYLS